MYDTLNKELIVTTPEQVQLRFHTAGIGSRAIAKLIDNLIVGAASAIAVLAVILASLPYRIRRMDTGFDYVVAGTLIFVVLLNAGYYICTEAFMGGRTIGKRIVGVRVLQDNGQPATFLSVLIRNLFRLLDMLPTMYLTGVVVMLFSKKDKRIGDLVAGTVVVVEQQRQRERRRQRIDNAIWRWSQRVQPFQLSEEQRSRIRPGEWELLSMWIEYVTVMPPQKLEELAAPIAGHLAAKLEQPLAGMDATSYLVTLYILLREEWDV